MKQTSSQDPTPKIRPNEEIPIEIHTRRLVKQRVFCGFE